MAATAKKTKQPDFVAAYETALAELDAAKHRWARTSIAERIKTLSEIRDAIMVVARDWAETASQKKQIPNDSPMTGEEWISGPYATLEAVDGLIATFTQMDGKAFLDDLPARNLASGQTAVKVLPHSIWDRLILSGITAEIWMQDGVTPDNLAQHAATAYDIAEQDRIGKVAVVLGAGNIAAIPPLDVFQKVFLENQVVILKMNPINDYLAEFFEIALKPLIDRDALRIVKGDGQAGAYLCTHPLVDELHVTGSAATHDAIVWGTGKEAAKNRKDGTPKNSKRFSSELGSVSPTIVVPGPWSAADIRFQAENIVTQKLHNSGHNCIACQALIMPKGWAKAAILLDEVKKTAQKVNRAAYYPGAKDRLDAFARHGINVEKIGPEGPARVIVCGMDDAGFLANTEVFAPALGTIELDAPDAETYLIAAVDYANLHLAGTLGANILIHPRTIRAIGKSRFEEILADFRYGTIAINGWSALGFLITSCPWGAFPGHTIDDVQSGIGTVHNTFMLEQTERVVVRAPWRPFPRNLLSGGITLLPRPPFFVTNRRQHILGPLLTEFQYKPGWLKIPRLFFHALLG